MTKVFNIQTKEMAGYSLPPKQALINAYEQIGKNNWHWWDYASIDDYPIIELAYCYCLGSFMVHK